MSATFAHDHLGNHSATQYPTSLSHAEVAGRPAKSLVTQQWIEQTFHSGGSTTRRGRHQGAWRLFGRLGRLGRDRPCAHLVPRHDRGRLGQYGRALGRQLRHPDGVIYSYPVTVGNGEYRIVPGLSVDDFSRKRMEATHAELREEREGSRAFSPEVSCAAPGKL